MRYLSNMPTYEKMTLLGSRFLEKGRRSGSCFDVHSSMVSWLGPALVCRGSDTCADTGRVKYMALCFYRVRSARAGMTALARTVCLRGSADVRKRTCKAPPDTGQGAARRDKRAKRKTSGSAKDSRRWAVGTQGGVVSLRGQRPEYLGEEGLGLFRTTMRAHSHRKQRADALLNLGQPLAASGSALRPNHRLWSEH